MPAYTLEIIVASLGLVILALDAFAKIDDKRSLAWLGSLGLIAVFALLFKADPSAGAAEDSVFWDFYARGDSQALFYKGIAILCTLLVLVMAAEYSPVIIKHTADPESGAHPQAGLGEFFALPLFACAGLMWMASANNLVSIFVSLELVTITFYVLVAYLRHKLGSLEAGVKYLVLGALSTGFLVYGFAWLYGITGSMELPAIAEALAREDVNRAGALFAFALILVAMAFKVGAAPFHMWIPDVYQGAPTPVTAFLSVGSKAAGFIVFLRLASPFLASPVLVGKVAAALAGLAIITLLVGNLSAIPQKNFKRLLAYSSIAHAGFLVMALACAPTGENAEGLSPAAVIAFYLGAYLLMTLLAFLVMTIIRQKTVGENFEDYRGLARRSPFLAFALLVSMASLAGIPLTAGFFGKLFVFGLAVQQGQWLLLAVGLIGAAAGFYYYLKLAASMYLDQGDSAAETSTTGEAAVYTIGIPAKIAIVALLIAIVAAGVNPNLILGLL